MLILHFNISQIISNRIRIPSQKQEQFLHSLSLGREASLQQGKNFLL